MNNLNDISVTIERILILYDTLIRQNMVTFSATVIIAYVYMEQFSSIVLLAWSSFMMFGISLRFWCLVNYKKNAANISDHSVFETYYIYATGVVGLGWAIFIALSLSLPSFTYRIYSLLLFAAMAGMAIPVFMSSIKTLYAFILPPLLVAIPLLLIRGGEDSATGIAVLIYGLVIIRSGKYAFQTLVNSITERIYNQNLVKELEQARNAKSASEKRMQSIMDYAPAAIYVKDIDGHFIFLNQKVADLHHMQREEIIGKTLHDILPEDIAEVIRNNDMEVINAKKPLKYEEITPQDDGLHHYISIKFPLFDESGKLYAVGGVSTDITERFRIEESLRISQQSLLLHREQSPLAVIEWNTDFEITCWNPAAQYIFGYTEKEVLGHRIMERIVPENARQAVDKICRELLANEGGTHSINENTTKDGRTILCEWHNSPLVDGDGNLIGVISLVDDITERQKNEESLRHSQKMDAIGKLTGGIAHDFNNMLGVILGFSELLKKHVSNYDPKLIKYNNEIINAAERAKKLTSKLLEFSRKAPSSTETADINSLLLGMRNMLEITLTPRIKLVYELQENIWPIWLDKARLEDAILNMCINSMHAMPDGGTLSLTTCNMHLEDSDIHNMDIMSGDYVLLSVSDTGIGMNRETQEKIFDPFFTTKGVEGTGLGLSQVYGFVQQAGGNIQVFSELKHGTRIAIHLPRHLESEAAKLEGSGSDIVKASSGNETILVVDDEVALLELTEDILTTCGYTVLRAENAKQALQILENKSVDMLISDVVMPGMDGYQLATEVKKRYPKIKIQMVSGFSDERNINLANHTLHQQRLQKPYTSKKLLSRIRQLLDEEK